jgi:hypothetical protein
MKSINFQEVIREEAEQGWLRRNAKHVEPVRVRQRNQQDRKLILELVHCIKRTEPIREAK